MAWTHHAIKKEIANNFNKGMMREIHGMVLHITDVTKKGALPTMEGVRADFSDKSTRRSAHFCISKTGEIWQFVDTADRAWAIDGFIYDWHWISVENIAKLGEKLTTEQLYGCGLLLGWLHSVYSVPLKLANNKDERGLGYHVMFKHGDHVCPGKAVIAQRQEIISIARDGF